ncbi:MAG: hypothetical protein Kow0092_15030 [Deferrisomatales bacterium]
MSSSTVCLDLLRRTRRRALVLGCLRGALAGWTGLAAGPVASTLLLPWLPDGARAPGAALCLVAGAALGAWMARREWRRARPRLTSIRAARAVTAGDRERADLILTGADIAGWGEEGARARGASEALARAQLERAAAAAEGLDPAQAFPTRQLAPWAARAALAAGVLLVWAASDPGGSARAWGALFRGGAPRPVTVGNLAVVYAPPAYTGQSAGRVVGFDGSVDGLAGTRVTLEGELSRPVEAGQWIGPGSQRVPLTFEGARFSVSWVLDRPGGYTLRFDQGGRPVPSDFSGGSITVREDARPRVELIAPEADLEVTTDREVEVVFAASDDWGVQAVELVLQGEREVRLPVPVTPGKGAEGRVRVLPLAHPELGAGAHLWVEARDGDTVGGPKTGASRSVYLTFLDKGRLVAEIEDLEERLLEALLHHLADHLELEEATPRAVERLRERAKDLLRLFSQLADRVRQGAQEGALGALAVLRLEEGLRGALEPFLEAGGSPGPVVEELERDVLFLDRLLRSVRMEETLSLADELAALQRGLFDRLQAGDKPEDLVGAVDRIRELLARMAEKMSRAAAEMPDAFANADAVRNAPANRLRELLEKLRDALARGDRRAAEALAEELLEMLGQWTEALEEAAQGAGRQEIDPALRELLEVAREVGLLSGDQERLLGETQGLAGEASDRVLREIQDAMDSFLARQDRRLRIIEESARRLEAALPLGRLHARRPFGGGGAANPDRPGVLDLLEARRGVEAGVAEVREALREDLARARRGAEALERALEALIGGALEALEPEPDRRGAAEGQGEVARGELRALRADLDALTSRRRADWSAEERRRLEEMAGEERGLGDRAGAVAERLRELLRKVPFLPPGLPDRARSAQGAMGEAAAPLQGADPFAAVPPETRALEELAEISRSLEGAQRQMLQGMEGGGFQVLRSPGAPGGSGLGREADRSPVEIPKEAQARELRAFREEVLRAMREGRYPRDYEDEVERYYERLIR